MRAFIQDKDPPPKTFHAGFVGLMAQLPNLRTLAFSAAEASYMNPQKDLYCLAYFPRLQSLELNVSSHGEWEPAATKPLRCLTALSSLQLHISDLRHQHLLLDPSLSRLSALKSLSLIRGGLPPRPLPSAANSLLQVVSRLSRLSKLHLGGMISYLPAELAKLSQLQLLVMSRFQMDDPAWGVPASFVPGQQLTSISLEHLSQDTVHRWWGVCRSIEALSALRSLSIRQTDLSCVPADDWAFSHNLTSVVLWDCELDNIPAALCSTPSLIRLELAENLLSTVPHGQYLEQLEHLDVRSNYLKSFPDALASATRLQKLVLSSSLSDEEWWDRNRLEAFLPATCHILLPG